MNLKILNYFELPRNDIEIRIESLHEKLIQIKEALKQEVNQAKDNIKR